MVKRLLIIPLVIIFTIAAFTLPSFGVDSLPDPVLSFTTDQYFPSGSRFYLPIDRLSNPEMISLAYDGSTITSTGTSYLFELPFDIEGLDYFDCTFVFRSRHFNEYIDFSVFSPYIVLQNTLSLTLNNVTYDYHSSSNSFSTNITGSQTYEVYSIVLKNVPAGYYSFIENNSERLLIGFTIDDYSFLEPEPEPVLPSVFLTDLGSVVTSGLGWVSQSVNTIVSHPFLLLITGFLCLGAGISFLGRLISRD